MIWIVEQMCTIERTKQHISLRLSCILYTYEQQFVNTLSANIIASILALVVRVDNARLSRCSLTILIMQCPTKVCVITMRRVLRLLLSGEKMCCSFKTMFRSTSRVYAHVQSEIMETVISLCNSTSGVHWFAVQVSVYIAFPICGYHGIAAW